MSLTFSQWEILFLCGEAGELSIHTSGRSFNQGLTLSFPITKIDRARREVWGIATSEALDQQGEVVEFEGSKKAWSKWTDTISRATDGKSLGNVREMHGPTAVGKLIAAVPNDEKKHIYVGAKISESEDGQNAWKKIEEGVLTGFSIGAPFAERVIKYESGKPVTHVTNYELSELSVVDNPACPEAFFTMVKGMAGTIGISKALAAFPDGENVEPRGDEVVRMPFVDLEKKFHPKTEDQRKWVSEKIKLLVGEGKDPDQAAAIAYSMAEDKFNPKKEKSAMSKKEGEVAVEEKPIEKGTTITAHQTPAATGEQEPETPSLKAPEEPPSPAKSAGATQDNDTPIKPPDGMGKDGEKPVKAPEGMGKEGEGKPMKPAVEPKRPEPNAPIESKAAAAGADMYRPGCKECSDHKSAKAKKDASVDSDELKKFFSGTLDGFQKAMLSKIEEMSSVNKALVERVAKLEAMPLPGGPARTELPDGVRPVEKAAIPMSEDAASLAIEKAMQHVADPFTRDRLSIEAARLGIKKAQRGR